MMDVGKTAELGHNAENNERRQAVEKSLKRKLDLRCSIFVLIYIMSESLAPLGFKDSLKSYADYLDRNNIGAARLKGLQADLKLTDTQYATCLSVLYAGYIIMQVPSNMIVNRISRPSIYIGVAVSFLFLLLDEPVLTRTR